MAQNPWLQAARLRTLPLAAAGIIAGASLGHYTSYKFSHFAAQPWEEHVWWSVGLLLLTALLLQVLSNFANDYGDFAKGTDNDNRIGPERSLQSGALTPKAMKRAMVITGFLALLTGVGGLYLRFEDALLSKEVLILFGLGLVGIWAAIKYTVGKNAFGYRGLGDVFVFLFFGLVAVMGSFYVVAGFIDLSALFGSVAIGFGAVAVLNLNNMRDIENDRDSGKRTLVVLMGLDNARTYQGGLIMLAWGAVIALFLMNEQDRMVNVIWFFPALLVVPHLKKVMGEASPETLDPELKKVALGTFFLALAFALSSFGWTVR